MSVEVRFQDAARSIENLSRHIDSLSRFCTVFPGTCERSLRTVLVHLGRLAETEPPDGLESTADQAIRSYLELLSLLLVDYSQVRLDRRHPLREFILERLLIDEHIYLQHAAQRPVEQVDSGLIALMQSDLRALQGLAESGLEEWLTALTGFTRPASQTAISPLPAPPSPMCPARTWPWEIDAASEELKERFRSSSDWSEHVGALGEFAFSHGCGRHQATPAFRISPSSHNGKAELTPLAEFSGFDLAWYEGNEARVEVLDANTRDLLDGYGAQNVLVWGPRGCGKSSLIRGLIGRYYTRGLRGIEIGPHQYAQIPELYSLVRERKEAYIAVLDNISLDSHDQGYRHLSSLLDGGLEEKPRNLAFYATSNFKDLIDREGERQQGPPLTSRPGSREAIGSAGRQFYDPQSRERLDERRAIDDRFALKVFIDLPGKRQYESMVMSYARRASLEVDEGELLAAFEVWRMRHNHDLVGGRTARDFIAANLRTLSGNCTDSQEGAATSDSLPSASSP